MALGRGNSFFFVSLTRKILEKMRIVFLSLLVLLLLLLLLPNATTKILRSVICCLAALWNCCCFCSQAEHRKFMQIWSTFRSSFILKSSYLVRITFRSKLAITTNWSCTTEDTSVWRGQTSLEIPFSKLISPGCTLRKLHHPPPKFPNSAVKFVNWPANHTPYKVSARTKRLAHRFHVADKFPDLTTVHDHHILGAKSFPSAGSNTVSSGPSGQIC